MSATVTSTTTTTTTTTSKGKSHVKELKRLFESKKTATPITPSGSAASASTPTSSQLKYLSDRKSDVKPKSPAIEISGSDDPHKDKPANSIVRSKSTSNHTLVLNFDNLLSNADKKYYFYVNEAIRKNIPIVPSLAIRRKSIDLTNSPIKGSLYAQKYQHSYSPSTRTIQLSKNMKSFVPTSDSSQEQQKQFTKTLNRHDRSWIKGFNSEIDFDKENNSSINSNNNYIKPSYSPPLPISKSTFELKPVSSLYISKEEPVKLGGSSGVSFSNKSSLSPPSHNQYSSSFENPKTITHTKSVSKLKLSFTKTSHSSDSLNPPPVRSTTPPLRTSTGESPSSPPATSSNNADIIPITKNIFKKLSWVTSRRSKRSNTVDNTNDPTLLISPPKHNKHPTTSSKPPIKPSSSVIGFVTTKPEASSVAGSPSGTSPNTAAQNANPILNQKSLSSPPSPTLSPTPSPSYFESGSDESFSPPLLSPENRPSSPPIVNKRVVSVAKLITRSNTLTSPTLSAPSSPVISPIKEALLKNTQNSGSSSSFLNISQLRKTAELKTHDDDIKIGILEKKQVPILLESVTTATRVRSASVGHMAESHNRFEVQEIPPLKVHCSSLEECMEIFEKPDPPHGRCFVLDLGNCSLGDDGLIQIADQIPGNLEIADLSWNDLTFDGLAPFYQMLSRTKSLFTSLSLQGNSVDPNSIQLLLNSIEMDPSEAKPKKDYKGFGLNLKETSIENEGAEYIANYLEHNRFPHIIGLNLVCASVTDVGMGSFSMALKKSTSLTTLILDENYLGDEGALLLADGLRLNNTLTHLQLRNTDIGEKGTIEICNSCKFNNTIQLLDLSLNPWQLGGEIALQSLSVHKQQQYILQKKKVNTGTSIMLYLPKIQWKDDGMESSLEVEEIEEIVMYFGTDKIIDVLMIGIQFTPLVEKEKLFESINIETKHLSKIFQNIISTNNTDDHTNSLKLLVQLLPTHLEKHTFIHSFTDNLPSLISLLDRPQIDFLILDILDFFAILTSSNNEACFELFNRFSLFPKAMELLFKYPKNNILHQSILNLLQSSTQTYLDDYRDSTFSQEFLVKLSSHLMAENQLLPGKRLANFGHLLELSKIINNNHNPLSLDQVPGWNDFISQVLEKEQKLQENFLCGFIPDRNQKLNPEILSKFEKEFKK